MFYTLSSRLLVPPNTIFVTDHTTGYFVNVLPDWLIVSLSLECYIVICIDWLYVHFTALCFSHVEVRFDISVIKELIDWLIDRNFAVEVLNILCSSHKTAHVNETDPAISKQFFDDLLCSVQANARVQYK